jgi:molecular chaperone GrpE (heat shock protein)
MPGLPKEQIKRREALKAQHPELIVEQPTNNVLIPINPEAPPVEEPVVVAPPEEEPTPPPLSLEQQWKLEAEKAEQRWKTLQGVVERLQPELENEKRLRSELEKEMKALRDALPPPVVTPDPEEEWTEEETKAYADARTVIEKVAKKVAKGQLNGALAELRKEIAELKESNTRVQTDLSTTSEQQFLTHVRSVIPNFDKIVESSEWRENYLPKKIPYSGGRTIYDALAEAHNKRDIETIKEIFSGFKPNKSALDLMRSPTLNGGDPPRSLNGTSKTILKWSDRKKISDDFKMGRIKKEERDKWDKLFREAEAEGRIDYQK